MKNFLNLGFIVLVLVVLGCNCSKLDEFTKKGSSTPAPTVAPSSTPVVATTPATTQKSTSADLTNEKADKVKNGMSRADVEAILGPGVEVSTNKGGGLTFVVMKWTDSKFNYMVITFRNDKVFSLSKGIK
jgi:hypothetical protein